MKTRTRAGVRARRKVITRATAAQGEVLCRGQLQHDLKATNWGYAIYQTNNYISVVRVGRGLGFWTRLAGRLSVCLSVCLTVCLTGWVCLPVYRVISAQPWRVFNPARRKRLQHGREPPLVRHCGTFLGSHLLGAPGRWTRGRGLRRRRWVVVPLRIRSHCIMSLLLNNDTCICGPRASTPQLLSIASLVVLSLGGRRSNYHDHGVRPASHASDDTRLRHAWDVNQKLADDVHGRFQLVKSASEASRSILQKKGG